MALVVGSGLRPFVLTLSFSGLVLSYAINQRIEQAEKASRVAVVRVGGSPCAACRHQLKVGLS